MFFRGMGYSRDSRSFWYDYYGNGVCGPGYRSYRVFKTGKLAVMLAGAALIIGIACLLILIF